MGFKYYFYCILLFYHIEAGVIEVVCPKYCVCDIVNDYRRATCQNKTLVTVEIGISPAVELLDLSHNQIGSLGSQVFSDMQLWNLKLLNLSYNKISQIDLYSFEGLDHLKSLDLSFNSIQYLLEQWFFSLRSLRELYLRENNLAQINKQPTINLPKLKVLDISDNKIEHLHPNVFKYLPSLEILDICDNFLLNLRVEVITPLPNLRLLVAEGNNMNCKDRSMKLLRHYIKENDIAYVGPCKKRYNLKITDKTEKFEKMIMETTTEFEPMTTKAEKLVTQESSAKKENNNVGKRDKPGTKKAETGKLPKVTKSKLAKVTKSKLPKVTRAISSEVTKPSDNFEAEIITNAEAVKPGKHNKITTVKNGWIIDEDEENQKGDNIEYIEVCNNNTGTTNRNFTNPLDKMAMELLEISPSGFLILSTLLGVMAGMALGVTIQSNNKKETLKELKQKIVDVVKKYFPNSKFFPGDGGINIPNPKSETKDEKTPKERKDPQDRSKREADPYAQQEATVPDWDDSDDPLQKLRPRTRSSSSKRGRKSPREDKSFLLDDEEPQDGSTPAMMKKPYPEKRYDSPRSSESDGGLVMKPKRNPKRRDRGRRDSDPKESEDEKPRSGSINRDKPKKFIYDKDSPRGTSDREISGDERKPKPRSLSPGSEIKPKPSDIPGYSGIEEAPVDSDKPKD